VEEIPVLGCDGLNPMRGVLDGVLDTEQTCEISTLTHLLIDTVRNLLGLIPLGDVWFDLGLNPFPGFIAESCMGLVEVGGVVLCAISN
jgi:hypothetical protein